MSNVSNKIPVFQHLADMMDPVTSIRHSMKRLSVRPNVGLPEPPSAWNTNPLLQHAKEAEVALEKKATQLVTSPTGAASGTILKSGFT